MFGKYHRESGQTAILLHCHLFKNAGSTIDWALRRSFGRGFKDHRDDQKMIKDKHEYLRRYLDEHKHKIAISSHHMPFYPESLYSGYKFMHIAMLRHPIIRAASVYQYELKQPEVSLGAKMAKQLDMRGYFEWRMRDEVPASIRNFHVRYLAGIRNPARKLHATDFDLALERAARDNVLIGCVEKFDESMVFLEKNLLPSFPGINLAYVKQNQNHAQPEDYVEHLRQELGMGLFERLMHENALDIQLYELLSHKFEARFEEIANHKQLLDTFQARCTELH